MKHLLLVCLTVALLAQSWGTQRQDEDLVRDRRDVEEIEEEEAPNGWGPWATVGKCSRSCGGGIHYEERSCYQTSGDEDLCLGPSKRYVSCNIQDCPADSTDFRHVQCANFNTQDFNGKFYEWVPHYEVDDESVCELNCQAVGETFYNHLAKWVVDGTRCRPDSTDICITGVCKPVGCDGVLGSNQEYDECRVCGGDGSSCHFKKGSVATDKLILGYNDILLIPAGATNIHIQEKEASNNYIAVRNLDGEFYFNKEWVIDPSGVYDIAGTKFKYHRGNEPALDPEYLSANGPTTEAVYVTVLSQSLADKPEILYELYMPNLEELKEEGEEVYSWEAGTWGKCSRHCNTGDRQRAIRCLNSEGGEVDLDLCDESTKPEEDENCNTQKCEASWYVGFWEDCLAECGEGEQERTVFCQQEHEPDVYVMVEDVLCKDNPRPRSNRPCDTGVPCPEPQVSANVVPDASPEASQVSEDVLEEESPSETESESEEAETSDAMSEATSPLESMLEPEASPSEDNDAEAEMSPDDASDVASENELVSSSEWDVSDLLPVTMTQPEKMMASVEALETGTDTETAAWKLGPWSACNQVCGSGTQIRHVYCARMGTCDPSMKPTETQECNLMPCEGVEWVTSDWQGCSESCEGGTETRTVVCSTQEGTVYPDNTCDLGRKPIIERPCPSTCVPKPKWHTSEWSQCSVRCGSGVQKRRVICAVDNGDTLTVAMESECDAKAKMPEEQPCTGTDCTTATWFSAPFGKCSAECGGGQKKREVLCFSDGSHVDSSHCDANQRPALYEDCNNQPCDEDNLLIVGGCKGTRHGCCPDGLVAAEGPNYLGCPARDPIPRGACIEMDFGCCLDGITPAQGPFLYGCPKYTCKDTEYGCCSDGQTAAKGRDGEGCPDRIYGCDRYGYGCCPDRMTSATGPNHAGCPSETPVAILVGCAQTAFGCCADGVTAAAGVNHLGCPESHKDKAEEIESSGEPCDTGDCNVITTSCSSSLHGCCQDRRTPASGPDYLGCPSPKTLALACASTAYGCCPDGNTPALGANNKGCDDDGSGEVEGDCQTNAYGCCPDGSTAAQGPSYEGCDVDCDVMVYGCCPEGVHAAKGPNFLGCAEERAFVKTCADDKYGCCPDGKTPTLGPYNAGCPSVIAKRAECGLPNERGPCSNYTVRWAFDVSYGECSRFWYGGCEGNGNNFLTKEECRQGCVHPDSEIEMCYLPKSVGRCRASVMRYYYNVQTRQCEEFSYGGCLGNDNRFETREVCEMRCVAPHTPDVCNQPSLVGPCRGHFRRWFYDHTDSTCKQFVYGGCQGNDNRFNSKDDCEQRCLSPATTVCRLNKDVGPCKAYFKSWYFDASTGQCVEFGYGGCGGNNNRFTTKDECKKTCRELLAEKQIDICSLPKETGPCTAYFERWYYDKSDGYCKMFVYGGCQGNKNRFIAEEECRSQCRAKPPVDVCTLPKAVGSCDSAIQRYFFNAASATCEEFLYSGCGGNGNSFDTLEECEKSCDKHVRKFVVPKGKERCYQPVVPGPCLNSLARYHYNSVSGECEEFQYGGCGGNHNRFLNIQQCEDECKNTTTAVTAAPTTPDVTCTLNYDSGGCFAYIPMFYFDTEKAACIQFIYGGCGGNTNRFKTRLACEQRCQSKKQHSVTSGLSICVLPKETGVCDGVAQLSVTKWYYNMEAGQCEKFIYSLCGGNENRFKSKTECEEACPVADICHLESMTGPCRASKRRYTFDAATGKCDEFTYGGCNGNANRFLKLESCDAACQQFATITTAVPAITTELEMCSKPREAGKCHTYTLRWYHDKIQEKCSQFVFSGCGGNDNNFQTEEECERRCHGAQVGNAVVMTTAAATTTAPDDEDVCALSKETGPCNGVFDSWYYDSAAGKCLRFVYGGCDGNGNKFETKKACQRKCSQPAAIVEESEEKTDSSGDDDDFDICQLKQDMGTCYNYQIKWFYDASISRCRRFYYGSCDGNGNRFENREECVQMCVERKVKPKLGVVKQDKRMCDFTMDVGQCDESIPRWHFDKSLGKCIEFQYTGCDGNANNFVSRDECESLCVEEESEQSEYQKNKEMGTCRLPKVVGPCFDEVLRFYFDEVTGLCRPFLYGGCQGNNNNFKTQEECYAICTRYPDKYETTKPGDCFETSDAGNCDLTEARWFFDANKGDCVAFYYGGCNGNGNNFKSYDDCIAFCSKVSHTCGVLTCDLSCPHGFARGVDGCQECKCLDPCEKMDCPDDQMCVIEKVACRAQPCPAPKAVCKATEAPVILTEKTQYTVAEGGIVVIPCKSRAAPLAQVTWYKDRKPLRLSEKLNGFRRLTDGSLEISHVTQNEHGIYTCRAFNSIGAATKTFTLLVQVAPVFEDTPREVVATAGDKAVLECAASGSPKPRIRWLRNHQLISIDMVHIMQWQNGTLVIDDVQEADAGSYMCEANNGMEAPPSRVVSLTVLGRMYVSLDKSEVTTDRGEELKLVCRTRSEPDISLEWSKDGDMIDADDSHIEVMENELFIKELRVADSGEYTCTASRGLKSVSATAIVKVKGIDLPDNCTDKPWYANCKLIIEGGYCTHPYFKVFCCKSCYEAGKLS